MKHYFVEREMIPQIKFRFISDEEFYPVPRLNRYIDERNDEEFQRIQFLNYAYLYFSFHY